MHSSIGGRYLQCTALLLDCTAFGALMRWSEGHGSQGRGLPLTHSMTSLSSEALCDSQAAASPQALRQRVLIPALTTEQGLAVRVFVAVWEKADATWLSQIGLRRRLSGHLWVTFSCRGQIDAMMHIWAVEQMQQFQLLQGTFLETLQRSLHSWEHNTPAKSPPSRGRPCAESDPLEGGCSLLLLVHLE